MPLEYNSVVPHIFVVKLADTVDREKLRNILSSKHIQTGIHYQPNHWLTYFKDDNASPLPITDNVFLKLLTLPLHADLNITDVDIVCDHIIAGVL